MILHFLADPAVQTLTNIITIFVSIICLVAAFYQREKKYLQSPKKSRKKSGDSFGFFLVMGIIGLTLFCSSMFSNLLNLIGIRLNDVGFALVCIGFLTIIIFGVLKINQWWNKKLNEFERNSNEAAVRSYFSRHK
jgi:hypothetical protein